MSREEHRPRERELVLAPNEYAYVLDTTKGHINCYVGPNKTSLAQTDQAVRFDPQSKRFVPADLDQAVQLFATAPAGWYVVLKNPAKDGSAPGPGMASHVAELTVGRKVNLPGPVSFALWPGQLARVIAGHRLARNQYLQIRVYDAEEAQRGWREALGLPAGTPEEQAPALCDGERRIIRGTDVSFYIPPTGVEVVPDDAGEHAGVVGSARRRRSYVRDAVTLGRLEYCVLVNNEGFGRYVRGEAVVFPEPDQRFVVRDGRRVFRAVELSETTGLYVKVTAPYVDEQGTQREEGDELFLTGAESRIYFPRPEHAVIRVGGQQLHQAVAIPRGEGRYLLDRRTGDVRLARGPQMLLADPRREVITRRVLGEAECARLYPGNEEAAAFNRALAGQRPTPPRPTPSRPTRPLAAELDEDPAGSGGAAGERSAGDDGEGIAREPFRGARTITLDTKYEGAVAVDVWSGYAVQVVDRSGARRVVVGPAALLLEYDETLQPLTLSTGVPKRDEAPLHTAYLQVAGNKISDRVELGSRDLVAASLTLKYRVDFEGAPERWFAVEDYVKLICDHACSRLKDMARQVSIRELTQGLTALVRDALLGPRPADGQRPGLSFGECGARVFDVEVLGLQVDDTEVAELLDEAQQQAVARAVAVADREGELAARQRTEAIERALADEAQTSALARIEREAEQHQRLHQAERARREAQAALAELSGRKELELLAIEQQRAEQRLAIERAAAAAALERRAADQRLELEALSARIEGTVQQAAAFSPQLIAALNRLGDEQLLAALSQNFGELAAVEGRGVLETARRFLDFIPASMVPTLKQPPAGGDE